MSTRIYYNKQEYNQAFKRKYKVRFHFKSQEARTQFVKRYLKKIKTKDTLDLQYVFNFSPLTHEPYAMKNPERMAYRLEKCDCYALGSQRGFSLYFNTPRSMDFSAEALGGHGAGLFKLLAEAEPEVGFTAHYTDPDGKTGIFDDKIFKHHEGEVEEAIHYEEQAISLVAEDRYQHHIEITCQSAVERKLLIQHIFGAHQNNQYEFRAQALIPLPDFSDSHSNIEELSHEFKWRKENWNAFRFYNSDGIKLHLSSSISFSFEITTTGGDGYNIWKSLLHKYPKLQFVDRYEAPNGEQYVLTHQDLLESTEVVEEETKPEETVAAAVHQNTRTEEAVTETQTPAVEDSQQNHLQQAVELLDLLTREYGKAAQKEEVNEYEAYLLQQGFHLTSISKVYTHPQTGETITYTKNA